MTHGQKGLVAPKYVPAETATTAIAENDVASPATNVREIHSPRRQSLMAVCPPTRLIRTGTPARLHGLAAVVTPPRNTAPGASQGRL
jgi:hypothetical protein